ncbi:MAG: sulfate permease, partial [Calditrichaeota bacterium]
MKKFFPILQWLPGYRLSWLKQDSVAGFTVAVMLIPQGMAYAMLAGMPAIAGLYGAMLALLAYTIFGTSRHVSIGPVAIDSILLVSGLSLMTHPGTESFILLAGLTALMVGTLQIIYGIGRMGFIVNFISHPVLSGFISAAAIIISLSQVKHILGITLPRGLSVPDTFDALIHALPQTHPVTLYMGLGSIIFLKVVKKIHASMPDALLLVILSILITAWFHLDEQGLAVVGTIPSGLPVPRWPDAIDLHTLRELLPLAVTMSMISFMEVVALGKKFASKYQYRIDPNQELIAIGSANVFSGLFRAYPMGASFSRSAVNAQSGAQTQLSDFFTAVFLGLTLLFFTPLFYYLPVAVLAAIILVAIVKLIDYKEPVRLFRIKKQDFWVLIFAFISTLIFGVQYGVLMGMGASVLIILQRLSRPHVARMGQIPGTDILRNFKRAPEARAIEGLFIFRIDASLAFTNVSFLRDLVEEEILNTQRPV